MADLFGVQSPPYGLVLGGFALIVIGAVYTYTGKANARFHGWIYSVDDPKGFWLEVGALCLFGLGLIGLFWYENSFGE